MTIQSPTESQTTEIAHDEVSLLDLIQIVVENLRLLVFGSLSVGIVAMGISSLMTPSFIAQTSFLPPQQNQSLFIGPPSNQADLAGGLGNLGGLVGIKNPADRYVSFLQSNSIKNALVDRFKLVEHYNKKSRSKAKKKLTANVTITSDKKDGIIKVSVKDNNPKLAADLANAHAEELSKLIGRLALTEAQQRRQFFEKQLQNVKEKLITTEILLRETGINADILKSNPGSATIAVSTLQAQITAQEIKLGAMRGYLAETAPEFKQAMTELLNLRSQLAKQSQSQNLATDDIKGNSDHYIGRYRNFKYQETLYELLVKQLEIAKLDEAREGATIQVIDAAQPPERRNNYKWLTTAGLAALATACILLVFIFARQFFIKATKDEKTAKKIEHIKAAWQRFIRLK